MSYDSKIQAARKVIDEHNANADNQINFEEFIKKLTDLGGSSEEALKAASWDDLQECGVPKIMARRLTYLFRQDSGNGGSKSTYISEKKASALSFKELVERYNSKDVKNPVGKRLKDLSDGKKFIIFDDNGRVIVDETVKLLEDLINGLEEVSTAFVSGRPFPVYAVGERASAYAEENPLYPKRPLRSNETCDQTGRSWQGVDITIRQLLYLAISTDELVISTVGDANDVIDRVLIKGCTLDSLRSRYPEASKQFDEASKTGQLPLLKIKLWEITSSEKFNNPFGKNTTY